MSIVIRGLSVCSPFFLAPINTGFGSGDEPDGRLIRFHEARSGRSIGISYVGNVAVGPNYQSNPQTLVLDSATLAWRELARVILENGSRAGIQLACKLPTLVPNRKWRSSRTELSAFVQRANREICSLSESDVTSICELFVSSAARAIDSGFEVVQIHAAHGYFLSQLMNPVINTRKDRYSYARMAALDYIVRGIRRFNPDTVIDVRLSYFDGLEAFEREVLFRREQMRSLIEMGVDIISLTAGMYEVDRFSIYPKATAGHALHLQTGLDLASSHTNTIWNIAGNIWDISPLGWKSNPNLTYSIGRSLIADPNFVQRSLQEEASQIRQCVRSGHCHYFSRGMPHLECKVNDQI